MTVTGHEEEFRRLFSVEATERLTRLVVHAHEVRSRGAEDELLDDMYRQAHTLRGGAGVVGYFAIADDAERLSQLIDEVRTRRRDADPTFADAVLAAVDVIRLQLSAERGSS